MARARTKLFSGIWRRRRHLGDVQVKSDSGSGKWYLIGGFVALIALGAAASAGKASGQ